MALVFYIKVVPGSRHTKWCLDATGMLKCFITAQPERGLANKELIQQLAQALDLRKSAIEISSGSTARIKKITINHPLSFEMVIERLINKQ